MADVQHTPNSEQEVQAYIDADCTMPVLCFVSPTLKTNCSAASRRFCRHSEWEGQTLSKSLESPKFSCTPSPLLDRFMLKQLAQICRPSAMCIEELRQAPRATNDELTRLRHNHAPLSRKMPIFESLTERWLWGFFALWYK
jgi:hypothetical protein